nr:transcription termination factor Rho [Ilumatobacteraceae bacterium]
PAPTPAAEASAAAPEAPATAAPATAAQAPSVEPDDEPPAEWELVVGDDADTATPAAAEGTTEGAAPEAPTARNGDGDRERRTTSQQGGQPGQQQTGQQQTGQQQGGQARQGDDEGDGRSRRRRRRRKGGRGDVGPQGEDVEIVEQRADEPTSNEPVEVSGYLDLRDEGYGFLRVKGYLPSRDDAYVPVKLTRQHGLRKGDHVTGLVRPAGRNEKNPALLDIHTVNGGDPEAARRRPRFEDLTALFPDTNLRLENPNDPSDMTARIIDLVAPIGKGQRGIIVSPPKAGKTTVMKTIATAIERNNPEVKLIVLLIDERPEEVTDMRRTVRGEVVASTFDRPSDEHTAVAELTIERAKRMVEAGQDVVIILDGITRLSRAYNLAAPASGRILSGGIDAGALYPPKKFFGAARNVEEGGSLTILATALVETNSRMDDAIFEEFKGTGNMELRLDRRLAERRIYPAIDVDASSTRHEELLFDRRQLQQVWKLRRVLSGLAADGNAAPGLELLIDRLKTFRTNDEFLNEIARQPSM